VVQVAHHVFLDTRHSVGLADVSLQRVTDQYGGPPETHLSTQAEVKTEVLHRA
jgi:hypothetical protein